MKSIAIGDRLIGCSEPCLIIAEAGVNHNGELQLAHDLVDAASEVGADVVKFQTWITDRICVAGAKKADYQQANSPQDNDQYTMLRRLELPHSWHKELQEHARQKGLIFASTPDEIESARFLCELGVPVIKIGSGELTNIPYLLQLARLGKPLILSTGMGDVRAVQQAVNAIRSIDDLPLALLHCVSSYPAPEEEMNLRCIRTLREEFGVPVGLSDHTLSNAAPLLGVGMEMAIWEKHLTLDRKMPGPDHAASVEPDEFAELVDSIRRAEVMMGDGLKQTTASEQSTRSAVRRILLYTRNLPAGHTLHGIDIEALRCGLVGLEPSAASRVEGRILRRSVCAGAVVAEADVR